MQPNHKRMAMLIVKGMQGDDSSKSESYQHKKQGVRTEEEHAERDPEEHKTENMGQDAAMEAMMKAMDEGDAKAASKALSEWMEMSCDSDYSHKSNHSDDKY